jgi:vesicle coat complex subunit
MNLQDLAARLQQQTRQSRFFGAARKGENYELRADLNSEYRDRRKDAIKRVIANMTVGKVRLSALSPTATRSLMCPPRTSADCFQTC